MKQNLKKFQGDVEKIDKRDKDKLIREYAPLIRFIAQKIAMRLPANIELDDLISSGVIGLMDAIDKYDPTRDNKFKTYAEFRIRGAILDELRAQDWVPRSVREKAKLVERTFRELEARLGRAPSEEEAAEALGLSLEEFFDLLNKAKNVSLLSLDDLGAPITGERRNLAALIEGCKSPNPYQEMNLKTLKELVRTSIEDLPEKQRLVLSLYYFEDLNLKEIGQVLDVTESRISQLHTQAVLRLRAKLKNHFEELM
jgi:RNA polymerase sigma factor for flagellar operon FliA